MKESFTIMSIFTFLMIYSCKEAPDINSTEYYNSSELGNISSTPKTASVKLDTLAIEPNIETSFVGSFSILNDTLYFSDEFFGYVFRFTKKGKLIDKNIGKGRGPSEILGFNHSIVSSDGYYFLNGGNSNLTSFNKAFTKENENRINWDNKRSQKEVLTNPIPTIGDSYEFDYGIPNIFKVWDTDYVSVAITASHPKFNGYFNSSLYYNRSRILALVNIKTGKVDRLFGRRSPLYLSYKNIPNFDHFNYEVLDDKVFVNFWADKTIYVINKETEAVIGKFGQSGKNMKVGYPTTSSYESAEKNWRQDRENYGYYNYIKHIPSKNIIIRGYTKGEESITDGLQIYKEYSLVSDMEVPKGFKVIGEADETLYGINSSDEEIDSLRVYKIKFEYP